MQELAKEELIELVKKIMDCDGTEEEIDNMILELEENVPHPEISDLIFGGEDKTAEQIVDIALNYKPIML